MGYPWQVIEFSLIFKLYSWPPFAICLLPSRIQPEPLPTRCVAYAVNAAAAPSAVALSEPGWPCR